MKCKLSNILISFSFFAFLFFILPVTAYADSVPMARTTWGIDELKVVTEGNGEFSSFHDGTVNVSKKGSYFMELHFKVTVTRTSGAAKVYLNNAVVNISGQSIPCTSSYYSGGSFWLMFSAPVDLYLTSQNFTLQCNWTYNTVNTNESTSVIEDITILDPEIEVEYGLVKDGTEWRTDVTGYNLENFDRQYKVTTTPSVSNSTFSIVADIPYTDGAWGRRFIYLGPIGYANGNQAVVDSITEQGETAHEDSLAQQQLQEENNQLLDDTMNGYDNGSGNAANDKLNSSLDSLDNAQSGITDGALSDLDSYTLSPTGVLGYAVQFGQTFSLVASMLQSIYTSAGNFNIIISVVFTLTISCMLLGFAKFFMR